MRNRILYLKEDYSIFSVLLVPKMSWLDLRFLWVQILLDRMTWQNGILSAFRLNIKWWTTKINEITKITQHCNFYEYDAFCPCQKVWNFVSLQVWHFTSCKKLYDTLHYFASMTQNVWHKKYGQDGAHTSNNFLWAPWIDLDPKIWKNRS